MTEPGADRELTPIRVRICGFQSLEDLELEIHGFTCITGPTNIGKSAIIRAISGALMNSPVTGIVRKGKKFCSVELETDGWGFKWEKAEKGVNRYWIPADADKPLSKVGQGQLDQVASMGFQSVRVGKDNVHPWLAPQFDPIFLMNKSGPAITDFISEVSRLKILQDAIILSARGRRQSLDKAKIREEDVETLRKKEESLAPLDNLLQVERDLEEQMESLDEWERRIETGRRLSDQLEDTAGGIRALLGHKDVRVPTDRAAEGIGRLGAMYGHWVRMEAAAVDVHSIRGVEEVRVPEGPSAEDMGQMALLRRFSALPELLEAVELLAAVELIPLPEGPGEADVRAIVKGAALAGRIAEAEQAVDALPGCGLALPDEVEWPSRLSRGGPILAEVEAVEGELEGLREKLDSRKEELGQVEEELALIPVCPACERPILTDGHVHG